jgi:hypothetical protein
LATLTHAKLAVLLPRTALRKKARQLKQDLAP